MRLKCAPARPGPGWSAARISRTPGTGASARTRATGVSARLPAAGAIARTPAVGASARMSLARRIGRMPVGGVLARMWLAGGLAGTPAGWRRRQEMRRVGRWLCQPGKIRSSGRQEAPGWRSWPSRSGTYVGAGWSRRRAVRAGCRRWMQRWVAGLPGRPCTNWWPRPRAWRRGRWRCGRRPGPLVCTGGWSALTRRGSCTRPAWRSLACRWAGWWWCAPGGRRMRCGPASRRCPAGPWRPSCCRCARLKPGPRVGCNWPRRRVGAWGC